MSDSISRRDLLKGSAVALGTAALAKAGIAAPAVEEAVQPVGGKPSGRRLRTAVIGSGGKGWSGMGQAAQHSDIVAICDVDARERVRAITEYPRAAAFEDFRQLLEGMKGDIDAVVISTTDHTHAVASAMAMKMGLHCYCEKPLTRTIWEARQLARIAREKRVATQMGNQSTASTPMRKAAALLKAGAFGAVREVHVWTDRAGGWWKQGVPRPPAARAPKPVNFDLWLGPASERPFAEGYHPFAWRGFWEFGTGSLGDMGCHIFNMPFMGLDLRDPLSVQAQTSGHNRETFPTWAIVNYEFGARGSRGPVKLTWYDGGKRPDAALAPGQTLGGNGCIVVCEKGTLFSPDESNSQFLLLNGGTMPDVQVDESPGHMAEFFRAATGGPPAVSNFPNYAGPLTETVLLGNLAIWADGPKLEWDARAMRVKGTNEFDSLIRPTYRPGWSL